MSLIGQEVFSAPGELVSVLMNGGPIDPNPIVSSILVANYVSSSQVLCDGVESEHVSVDLMTVNTIYNVSTIDVPVTTTNPTGSLYVNTSGNCRIGTQSSMSLVSLGGSMLLRSQSTLILNTPSSIFLNASFDVIINGENNIAIDAGGNLDITSNDTMTIDSGPSFLIINGTNWAQLVSTVAGLPRA